MAANASAFEIKEFTGLVSDPGGNSDTRAAGHPAAASTTLTFPLAGPFTPEGQVKDAIVDLPPGFVGNPEAMKAQCTLVQLLTSKGGIPNPEGGSPGSTQDSCPYESQVGVAHVFTNGLQDQYSNVYSMQPPFGSPARFGFYVQGVPVYLDAAVRSGADYGLAIGGRDIATPLAIEKVAITIWGVPYAPEHDGSRGHDPFFPGNAQCSARAAEGEPCENSSPFAPEAFLTNPADCSAGALPVFARATEWADPTTVHTASFATDENGNPTAVTGCDKVPFSPDIAITPSSHEADSPTGIDVELSMPQHGLTDPDSIAQAHLKRVTVTLPEGMTVNPSSADGLGACSAEQIGLLAAAPDPHFTADPDSCPGSSKIGTVEIQTPLLDHPIQGAVTLATPNDPSLAGHENPFDSLLALYLTAADPQTGVVLKLPGRVDPDPATGRLVARFDQNPQLPFTKLRLHLTQGSRAPLVAPRQCGTYEIVTEISSWSAADPDNPTPNETVRRTQPYSVDRGPGGAACPPGGTFSPALRAGTLSPIAGAYSPLLVDASRPDGSDVLKGISLKLPEGLLGKLAGVSACPESSLTGAGGRSGKAELASPSCPADSKLGTVDVAAGAGPTPFHVTGQAYLAGPYKGAPLSIAVITPAVAGPFDLGTVVTRAAAKIDPVTTQIEVVSDPIPTILRGIPLKVRSLSVSTDRPEFTINPTDCDPMALTGTLVGPTASKDVSSRFQVGACKALGFKPKLSLALKGAIHRRAHPSLRAVLTARPGDANIAKAQVKLPKSAFLDNAHITGICTRVQFAANACPTGSIYGKATATSPLLDYEVAGPVVLRANPAHKLPDLVVAFKGPDRQPVAVELAGKTDSVKGALRNTFEAVPDVPVRRFSLTLFGGKKGLVEMSSGFCQSPRAQVKLDAQSGAVHDTSPKVRAKCRQSSQAKSRGGVH